MRILALLPVADECVLSAVVIGPAEQERDELVGREVAVGGVVGVDEPNRVLPHGVEVVKRLAPDRRERELPQPRHGIGVGRDLIRRADQPLGRRVGAVDVVLPAVQGALGRRCRLAELLSPRRRRELGAVGPGGDATIEIPVSVGRQAAQLARELAPLDVGTDAAEGDDQRQRAHRGGAPGRSPPAQQQPQRCDRQQRDRGPAVPDAESGAQPGRGGPREATVLGGPHRAVEHQAEQEDVDGLAERRVLDE